MKNKNSLTKFAVIIYPEESGTLLASAFLEHKIRCLSIVPPQTLPDEINNEDYVEIIHNKEDIETLLSKLRSYVLFCILPGSERGVPLANALSAKLNLLPNDQRVAHAYSNKGIMADTVKAAGLKIPQQSAVTSEQQINSLILDGLNWPIIIKPSNSMGSENVNLCSNEKELRQSFYRITHSVNRLQRENEECIIQEYLKGTEYAIDTVSYDGNHYITAIWQYHKLNSDIIGIVPFHSKQLINSQGNIQTRLQDYLYPLLDSLGIRYGPAHTELVIEEDEVMLMEMGVRLHGGIPAIKMSSQCSGESQVDICALAYANPKAFLEKLSNPYTLTNNGEIALLITPHLGLYARKNCVKIIASLESVKGVYIDTSTTKSLARIAGLILLNHKDEKKMKNDLQRIRELETSNLYYSRCTDAMVL